MSNNLPAKPEPGEISPVSPPQDDRHYTGRTAPMAPPGHHRREEPRRNDVYIARSPPRARAHLAHGDSYVASDTYVAPPGYDRREDDRYRREYAEWDRQFGRDYYGSHHGPAERRERGHDRRTWEREEGGRSWEARHEYHRRDRAYRPNERPPRSRNSSDRGRRWRSRASVSPARRAGSHHPPPERRRSPGPPRRRQVSQSPSRSTSPSNSHQPSPTRRLRLDSHSIASPRSPRGHSSTRNEPRERRRRSSRSRSGSPSSRRRSLRRSLSPDKDTQKDKVPAVKERSPSLPRSARHDCDADLKSQHQSRSRSRSRTHTPAKAESVPDTVISNDSQLSAKGKVKEEPSTVNEPDIDIKMCEPSPPVIPTGPRGSLPAREPPKGPRGFTQPPIAPASRQPPTKPDWSRWNTAPSVPGPSYPRAELTPSAQTEPEPTATATLPTIPVFKSKVTLNPELEAEIARVQAHRAQLTSEHTHIAKAARRALHELEMASLDLRAAESRRKLADSHVERARLGVLGIDYLPTAST